MNKNLTDKMNELADHLHKTMPLHGSIGYTASKAFRDGFQTCHDLMLEDMKKLVEALKDCYAGLWKAWKGEG